MAGGPGRPAYTLGVLQFFIVLEMELKDCYSRHVETKTLRELLALGKALPVAQRVKLAHELLSSVADSRAQTPGEEIAEPEARYDRAYRAAQGRSSADLWQSLQDFRAKTDLELLDAETVYADVRDRSPGRELPS